MFSKYCSYNYHLSDNCYFFVSHCFHTVMLFNLTALSWMWPCERDRENNNYTWRVLTDPETQYTGSWDTHTHTLDLWGCDVCALDFTQCCCCFTCLTSFFLLRRYVLVCHDSSKMHKTHLCTHVIVFWTRKFSTVVNGFISSAVWFQLRSHSYRLIMDHCVSSMMHIVKLEMNTEVCAWQHIFEIWGFVLTKKNTFV